MVPDDGGEGGQEEGNGCGEDSQGFCKRVSLGVSRERDCEDSDGQGNEDYGEDGCGVENLIVCEVAGVVEEEVVLDAHVGDDGHGDLDVAAFVGSGDDVEGGEGQAGDGAGDGVDGDFFALVVGLCEANEG